MSSGLIDHIRKLISQHAETALTKPSGQDAYAYGHAVGFQAGLRTVLSAVEADIDREDEDIDEHGSFRRVEARRT